MPIADKEKVKTLAGITYTDDEYDTQILDLIPAVQDWLCTYLNNWFHLTPTYTASSFAFVDGSPATITDSNSKFTEEEGFVEKMDIHVEGSYGNDGIYEVVGLSADTLTLEDNEKLEDEDYVNAVRITRIKFPRALQAPFAQLIKFDLSGRNPDVASFRLGDYSETYTGGGNYPPGLLAKFNQWRNLGFRRGR